MKKNELKKAFNKEFEKIKVSNELKEKTLNAIKAPTKPSHIPYLKNIAAILVVGFLYLSIYKANTNLKKDFSAKDEKIPNLVSETYSEPYIEEEAVLMKSSPSQSFKSKQILQDASDSIAYESDNSFDEIQNLTSFNAPLFGTARQEQAQILEVEETILPSLSEKEFLDLHPDNEKTKNGYIIYENNQKVLYTFENGILKNTLIID